jgi:hypothetical protein
MIECNLPWLHRVCGCSDATQSFQQGEDTRNYCTRNFKTAEEESQRKHNGFRGAQVQHTQRGEERHQSAKDFNFYEETKKGKPPSLIQNVHAREPLEIRVPDTLLHNVRKT